MIWIYRAIYPLFVFFLWALSPFVTKIRAGLAGRFGLFSRLSTAAASWPIQEKRYWFHFSSAGEFEQALPILDALKKIVPNCYTAITYFSPSAEKAVRLETKRRQEVSFPCSWDFADYSPFDFPWSVKTFLNTLQPSAFVSIHRELWPELLVQCQLRNTPCYLFAAFFPENFTKGFTFHRFFLNKFKHIATVDELSRLNLLKMDPALKTCVFGDPRIERVLFRKRYFSRTSPWRDFFSEQPILIGASLWDEDFDKLLTALPEIMQKRPHCRLILVPHEPSWRRVEAWLDKLKTAGLEARRWNHWLKSPDSHSHLIVDQVGILAELYSIGTCVLVGGSFKKRVHNVLEPFVYGCSLVTGPFIHNSSEATELAKEGVLKVVNNTEELAITISELLDISKPRQEPSLKEGASLKYIDLILAQ